MSDITEAQFTANVIELAQILGWRTAHFRPCRTKNGWRTPVQGDGKGFPDLILTRGDRCLAVELKRRPADKPTDEQKRWLASFAATGIETDVWRPADMKDTIPRILSGSPTRGH